MYKKAYNRGSVVSMYVYTEYSSSVDTFGYQTVDLFVHFKLEKVAAVFVLLPLGPYIKFSTQTIHLYGFTILFLCC